MFAEESLGFIDPFKSKSFLTFSLLFTRSKFNMSNKNLFKDFYVDPNYYDKRTKTDLKKYHDFDNYETENYFYVSKSKKILKCEGIIKKNLSFVHFFRED